MNNLLILTKKYGYFTGATITTQKLVKKWEKHFDKIYIIALESSGGYVSSNVKLFLVSSEKEILKKIKHLKTEFLFTGYSDDHLGFYLKKCDIPYVHTYHGNWPDARYINLMFFLKSFYFIPKYKQTVRNAEMVVDVSNYMNYKFTSKHNKETVVIRNGINQYAKKTSEIQTQYDNQKIIMIGNVDKRKYSLCKKLFSLIELSNIELEIDIYGEIIDITLYNELNQYDFVNFLGKKESIDISKYKLYMSLSKTENLPISITEAIKAEIPVIALNVGGVPEVIKNSINGFLVSKKDYRNIIIFLDLIFNKNYEFKFYDYQTYEYNWDLSYKLYLKIFERVKLEKKEV